MTLAELKEGESAVILSLALPAKIKKRFYDLGLTEGVGITFSGKAPSGDPVKINLRDFCLAIRKCDAARIEVEKL